MLCVCRDPYCKTPYGYCHCGCGQKTSIAVHNHARRGYETNKARRYVNGHRPPLPPLPVEDAQPFKIDGVYCRLIPLTQGYWAIVDAQDYPRLAVHRWQAMNVDGRVVACRSIAKPYRASCYMHHEILPLRKPFETDHANRVPLDNRRKNLRYATNLENARNKGVPTHNTSGFKGVSLHKQSGKWRAAIRVKGAAVSLGLHATKESAARAYDAAAAKYFGTFAYLNFPPQPFQQPA